MHLPWILFIKVINDLFFKMKQYKMNEMARTLEPPLNIIHYDPNNKNTVEMSLFQLK